MALEFCSAHAGSVHGVVRRLYFASRIENRVVFRVALVSQTLGLASSSFAPIHRVAAEVFQRTARRIEVCRWSEVQSALPGMTIQDRLGKVHP
jgi:hypothetical protein